MTADLEDLLARVKAATGPDREIDCRLNWLWRGENHWATAQLIDSKDWEQKAYESGADRASASIDAALALVERLLPGYRSCLYTNGEGKGPFAMHLTDDKPVEAHAHAATLPLAILAALLTALIAQQKGTAQ